MSQPRPDFSLYNCGPWWLLTPLSDLGAKFVREGIPPEVRRFGSCAVLSHDMAAMLARELKRADYYLEVRT